MFKTLTISLFLCISLLLSSCGYKTGYGKLSDKYQTITIPFVDGDKSGFLTAELIKRFSQSGALEYRNASAELELKVVLLDDHEEHVGFQFDRDLNNNVVNRLTPTEGRSKVLAEISVIESSTGKTLLGPEELIAVADFDFDPDISVDNVTEFSLGQLSSSDSARDVAKVTTSEILSRKIVDYILNSWE
ncbi:Uncharacterized protein SCG7109_AP_00120 [Chlamydiales bacterium SCGC AG-110-M15]|nr:Uncharacterized protein SCG7109_AP_00120 [Chlamydiales bacterium SCGC AG-110-M15]